MALAFPQTPTPAPEIDGAAIALSIDAALVVLEFVFADAAATEVGDGTRFFFRSRIFGSGNQTASAVFVAIAASMLCVVVVFTSESRLSDVSHIPENNLRFGDEDVVVAAFVIKFSFSAESFPTFPPLFSSVPEFATSFGDTFDDDGTVIG